MRHSAKLPTHASNCFPEMEWLMKGRKVPVSLYTRNALGLMALPLNSTDRHHLPGWRIFGFFKYIKIKIKNNLQNKNPRYSAGKSSWHVVSELILSCPGTCQWKKWLDSENLVSLDFHTHRFDHENYRQSSPIRIKLWDVCTEEEEERLAVNNRADKIPTCTCHFSSSGGFLDLLCGFTPTHMGTLGVKGQALLLRPFPSWL